MSSRFSLPRVEAVDEHALDGHRARHRAHHSAAHSTAATRSAHLAGSRTALWARSGARACQRARQRRPRDAAAPAHVHQAEGGSRYSCAHRRCDGNRDRLCLCSEDRHPRSRARARPSLQSELPSHAHAQRVVERGAQGGPDPGRGSPCELAHHAPESGATWTALGASPLRSRSIEVAIQSQAQRGSRETSRRPRFVSCRPPQPAMHEARLLRNVDQLFLVWCRRTKRVWHE